MSNKISEIRRDYSFEHLQEGHIHTDPMVQFDNWFKEAVNARIDEVNAMTLATASADGFPSARVVLLKGYDERGFIFYTNYNSFKGQQLKENPKACLVFFWKELERQVRITGIVQKTESKESDEYFHSRPESSRIGAWASPQSEVIENRRWLDDHFNKLVREMEGSDIQRPGHWGGYILNPVIIEFWQGRPSRLHDRIQYSLQETGEWKAERLAP